MINCNQCTGDCCKYVAVEIDEPETKEEFDEIRWFVSHKNVKVYKDNEGDWLVEFTTICEHLDKDNNCLIYDKRPKICREHEVDSCIRNGRGKVEEILFETLEDVDKYLKDKFIKK